MLVTSRHQTVEHGHFSRKRACSSLLFFHKPKEIRSKNWSKEREYSRPNEELWCWINIDCILLTLNCFNSSSYIYEFELTIIGGWSTKNPAHCIVIVRHSIVFDFYVSAVERNYVFNAQRRRRSKIKMYKQKKTPQTVREGARMGREGTKFSQTEENFIVVKI